MSLCEQKAVYQAQSTLWGHGRRFDHLSDVVTYVEAILDSQWFTEVYGYVPPVTIQRAISSRWGGAADSINNIIYLVNFKEATILHELAHLVCEEKGHGRFFIQAYLFLINNMMGFYAWAEFKTALIQTEEFKTI